VGAPLDLPENITPGSLAILCNVVRENVSKVSVSSYDSNRSTCIGTRTHVDLAVLLSG